MSTNVDEITIIDGVVYVRRRKRRVTPRATSVPTKGGGGRLALIKSLGGTVYYPMLDTSGTAAAELIGGLNGTYNNVALANADGPFGGLAPQFVPGAGIVNMDATAAVGQVNAASGALVVALKIRAWTAGSRAMIVQYDANNYMSIYRSADNQLTWRRTGGGTNRIINRASITETGWIIAGMDWITGGTNEFKAFYQGAQEGSTLAATAFASAPTSFIVGATDTLGADEWDGHLAEMALFPAPLGAAGHQKLAGSFFTA